jgi:tetratricopeptide (TPR) repeat protein
MTAHPAHGATTYLRLWAAAIVAALLTPATAAAQSDAPDNDDAAGSKALKSKSTESSTSDQDSADQQYRHHTRAGRSAYENENYARAAEHFRQAYQIRDNPNVLYNLGRAREQQGDFQAAIDAYESFIDKPGVSLEARRDALERIRTLRDIVEMKQSDGDESAAASDTPDDAGADDTNATPSADSQPTSPPIDPPPDTNPPWGPILTIGGGTLLASGAIFGILTRNAAQNARNAGTLNQRRESARRGRAFAITADTSFALGLAATTVGAILWVPRLFNNSDTAQTTLRLSTTPHSLQLNLTF